MATKRSDYLKAMYSKMQNNVDKLSTFSSMNAVGDLNSDIANSISTANSIVNPSHQVKPENDRNWYQRTMDSISDIEYNISNGLFGFFDTIGDFAIDLLFSNEDWAEGAKNYDWVSQASYGTHIMANVICSQATCFKTAIGTLALKTRLEELTRQDKALIETRTIRTLSLI